MYGVELAWRFRLVVIAVRVRLDALIAPVGDEITLFNPGPKHAHGQRLVLRGQQFERTPNEGRLE